jgi:hypothetical protein
MPAWKVFDEETASELESRLGGNSSVVVDANTVPLNGESAVILAPTSHRGVTMLITAHRRQVSSSPQPVEDHLEQFAAEEPSPTAEPVVEPEQFFGPTTWERIENSEVEPFPFESTGTITQPEERHISEPAAMIEPVEDFYRPPMSRTTEFRDDQAVQPVASVSEERPIVTRPEIVAPAPRSEKQLATSPDMPPKSPTAERHYIASGFLGLEESVEDDDDRARETRPWWKRMFID